MKKQIMTLILAAALGTSALAGCGTSGTSSSTDETSSKAAAETQADSNAETKEVTFWHYFTSINGEITQKFVDEYNEMQDDIKINFEYVPRDEMLKQLTIGLVSGELPDMVFIDNPNQAAYSSMGLFADITDKFKSWDEGKFLDGPMASATLNDKIYGLPYASNCLAMYYDVDMLKNAGVAVPTTWSELKVAAKTLTVGNTYGFGFSAIGTEEGTFQTLPFLLSAGGNVNELDSEAGIEAFTLLSDMIKEGSVSKEVLNYTQGDQEKQFVAGNVAMVVQGPWIASNLKKDAPDKNWAVAMIPKADDGEYATTLGGENLAIIKDSESVDECWEFLSWFLGKDNNIEFCQQVNRFSPRSDVTAEEMWGDDAIMGVFSDSMKYAQARGPHPKWDEISTAFITALQETISGTKTAEAALKDAQVKVDETNASIK